MKGFKLVYWFYGALLFLVFLVTYAAFMVVGENVPLDSEKVLSLDSGWYYQKETGELQRIALPTRLDVPKGETARISGILPEDYENGRTLCLRSSQQSLRVLLSGQTIYEYGIDDTRPFGKAAGSAWHLVQLPEGSQGRMVTIELMSPYSTFSGQINAINFGSKSSILLHIIKKHIIGFLICFCIMFLGLAFLLFYFILRKKIPQNKNLLYLGLFALLVTAWSFTETRIPQLFFANTFAVLLLSYLPLMLCPVPLLFFIKGNYLSRHARLYQVICFTFLINFFVCTLLQIFNIADFLETVIVTHILVCASLLAVLWTCLEEALKYRNKKIYLFVFSSIGLCICVAFDICRFYMGSFEDNSFYFRIGLLFYIFALGLDTMVKTASMISLGREAKALKRLAYLDPLTKKKNRTAFDLEMEHLLKQHGNPGNIVLVEFDLNYFKDVNDTYGHKTGDEVLIASAQCIDEAFFGMGECFRIGGDEFVEILPDCDDEQLALAYARLKMLMSEYNETHENKLDIAWGDARFDPELDKDLYALLNRADKKMYQQKNIRKQGEGSA